MSEEYPEYNPYDLGDEECYELYAKKLKEFAELNQEFEYPLNKNLDMTHYDNIHKKILTEIDPCKFVKIALPKAHIRRCSLPYIMDAYRYGIPKLNPLELDIDTTYCSTYGHQGRHRAQVACDLGIKRVPITFDFLGSNAYTLLNEDKSKVLYKKSREAEKEIRKAENKWDTARSLLKEDWKFPLSKIGEKCTTENIREELSQNVKHPKVHRERVKKKRDTLRDKYNITKTAEMLRRKKLNL